MPSQQGGDDCTRRQVNLALPAVQLYVVRCCLPRACLPVDVYTCAHVALATNELYLLMYGACALATRHSATSP